MAGKKRQGAEGERESPCVCACVCAGVCACVRGTGDKLSPPDSASARFSVAARVVRSGALVVFEVHEPASIRRVVHLLTHGGKEVEGFDLIPVYPYPWLLTCDPTAARCKWADVVTDTEHRIGCVCGSSV